VCIHPDIDVRLDPKDPTREDAPEEIRRAAMKKSPNQITAHNAGWPSQFRFAGSGSWSGVCEFFVRLINRR
jgi:hypothetical protein